MIKKILTIILIASSLFASAQKRKAPLKYWEELTEKEKTSMLNDSAPAANLTALYNNKYYFGDAKADEILFKNLTSTNNVIVPLRVYLLNKLISASDTSIKILLQEYSVKMAFNQPDVLFRSFCKEHLKKKNGSTSSPQVYKTYIPYFAADLDEKIEYQNWKDFLDLYFMGANAETKQMLALIYKDCEKAGAGSKNPIPVPLPPKGKDD